MWFLQTWILILQPSLSDLTMHLIIIDENPTVTVRKLTMKNVELTVTDENVTATDENLSVSNEKQTMGKKDLSVTDENLRNTKKDQTMAYVNLTTLEGYHTSMDRKLDVGGGKPDILDEPTYHNLHHYHKKQSPPRNSLQHVYEEAIVDSYESQSSSVYQSLDKSTIDYLSMYSIPVGEGRGRDNLQTVEIWGSLSVEGNVNQRDDVAGQIVPA